MKLTDEELYKIREQNKLYPKPVPFDKMPKDVSDKLTKEEYEKLVYEKGAMVGLYWAIHVNDRFNEWHNLIIRVFADEFDVAVYLSDEGWVRREYKDIKDQLMRRFQLCNRYFLEKLIDKMEENEICSKKGGKKIRSKIKKALTESSEESEPKKKKPRRKVKKSSSKGNNKSKPKRKTRK
ncbi:MAG: hypothetical protein H0X03_05705 [Nitrosopumilus sp.]|nr:hypothetical protein [Nitrosopumilus sp.]